jgi:hypothetical protein
MRLDTRRALEMLFVANGFHHQARDTSENEIRKPRDLTASALVQQPIHARTNRTRLERLLQELRVGRNSLGYAASHADDFRPAVSLTNQFYKLMNHPLWASGDR